MSHYKPYPAYKDSGVEWLGQVPEHWEVLPLRAVASVNDDEREQSNETGESIRYIDISTVSLEGGIGEPTVIKVQDAPSRAQRKAKTGDVALSTVRTYLRAIGQVHQNHEDCVFSTGFAVIRAGSKLVPDFLYSGLLSEPLLAEIEANSKGVSYPAINASEVMLFKLPVPPKLEQERIAEALKSETARIDALISKKTRFIELLREKRQALITQAVTKGLDPHVKMKDSGVEWLGEVPAHWKLMPLKYLTPSLTVGIVVNPSDYVAEEGLPFLYGGDIGEGEIFSETARRISVEDSARNAKTKLMAGDLVTVRVGAPGVTAVVPPECEGGNCASVMLIRRGHFESDWLCYLMNSRVVRYQVEVVQYGAAQEQFNISHAVDFLIPVPSREEQAEIASALNHERKHVDVLLRKTERSIELLKERRFAIITAAVTGEIDLREEK